MKRSRLEFWADSFHEGNWACEELSKYFKVKSVIYEKNFIPVYLFELNNEHELEVAVLGSYKNWSPLPSPISYLIDWGKPDLVVYDPVGKKILFAMEETAAVPTGNQALQRCERMYGSLRSKIPFWYLLGEFGMHVDGGVRRDSIWPSILAIKLSCIYHTPCLVLHYSDAEHPEDYLFGDGVKSLYKSLALQIEIFFGLKSADDLLPILKEQYKHMLTFINNQWDRVVDFVPQAPLLVEEKTAEIIAEMATTAKEADGAFQELFNWSTTDTLPRNIYDAITPGGFIKQDVFIKQLELLVKVKKAYNLSGNAGSRPQDTSDLKDWIAQQKKLFNSNTVPDVAFSMNIDDFPISKTGLHHITTAKNVFYLVDKSNDLFSSLSSAYFRLTGKINSQENQPVFLYISNSMKPGRIFGDPFTGQLSAFANIFSKNLVGDKTRLSVAYYPHQVHTQLFDQDMKFRKNKGITIMRELLDYAVFHGGVLVNLKTGEII